MRRSKIERLAHEPAWTDHDVSDPGITLLELLAYSLSALAVAAVTVSALRRRRRLGDLDPD